MSEKLIVLYELEKEMVKMLSIESGKFYYFHGLFKTDFFSLTKETREMIYDSIRKSAKANEDNFYLDLTHLPAYYRMLRGKGVDFEEYKITEEFFKGLEAESFIKHYFDIVKLREESQTLKDANEKYILLKYQLHPDFLKAIKILEESEVSPIQTLSIKVNNIPEVFYHEIADFLTKDGEQLMLDFSYYEVSKEFLYAKRLFRDYQDDSDALSFIMLWIDHLKNESSSKKSHFDDKEKWIKENGSNHLKRAFHMGYDCQRQYVSERSKSEFPEFELDFDNSVKLKERPFPTEDALDEEDSLREKHENIHVRVEWMQKPYKEVEVVVIYDYLGKYTLYKVIN